MGNAISLYLRAEEVLAPILRRAGSFGRYDGTDGLLEKVSVEVVQKAINFLREANKLDYQPASVMLGECLYRGIGTERDADAAKSLFSQAASGGSPEAQFFLGRMYYYGDAGLVCHYDKAFELFQESAMRGNPFAQRSLGMLYEHGRGVAKNSGKAVEWYRKASDSEEPLAQFYLGRMYAVGSGVKKDEKQALFWYHKAAEQGHSGALNNLGLMYENGAGVVKNLDKALILYRDAARKGSYTAKGNLVRLEEEVNRTEEQMNVYRNETDEAVSSRAKAVLAADQNGGALIECNPLMDVCTPSLYLRNAFRITGLHVDARPRDARRRDEDLKAAVGASDWANEHQHGVPLQTLPTPDDVKNAFVQLQDPEHRFINEFFWFWPLGMDGCKQDKALQYFFSGECKEAYSIWNKAASGLTDNSIFAIHNLAVYHHLLAIEGEWEETDNQGRLLSRLTHTEKASQNWNKALTYWEKLIDSEFFWEKLKERVRVIDDARLSEEFVNSMRLVFPVAFDKINAVFASKYVEAGRVTDARRHLDYMAQSHQGLDDVERTLSAIVLPVENRIKMLIENAVDTIRSKPGSGLKNAKELLQGARSHLDIVNGLLEGRRSFEGDLSESVALAVFSCLIAYGNKTENWEPCITLLSEIEILASTEETKKKIRENRLIAEKNFQEKEIRERCWFCKRRKGTTEGILHTKMYGDVVRTRMINKTHIQWRNTTVDVPRCDVCKEAHSKFGVSLTAGGAGALVGTAIFPIVGSIIGLVVGSVAGSVIDKKMRLPEGVSPKSAQKKFPAIKDLLSHGWKIGERPIQ